MSGSRKFTFRNLEWACSIEFFPDRVEYSWDFWGLGVDKGKRAALRQELTPTLTETTGRVYRAQAMQAHRWAIGCLILAMFSYVLLPPPWRNSTYLFLAAFAVQAYRGFNCLRKGHWIQIFRRDGKSMVSVQVTKWTEREREEFRDFYAEWINRPEWADGLTIDS
ncbi:MAG TPA: hypothetical protein VK717_10430 [Opitutaceae bacterium]|jgi:hypothetical protein|nr:hypothetical protein [Opitutaceae bacterium]